MKRLLSLQTKILYTLTLGFSVCVVYCQNLVLNPGFEEHTDCEPPFVIDTNRFVPSACPHWWVSTLEDAVHYDDCNAYISTSWWNLPHTGDGWAAIGLALNDPPVFPDINTRTFLQTKLSTPLEAGCSYEVYFHLRPFGQTRPVGMRPGAVFINGVGAHLSKERIFDYHGGFADVILHPPQIEQAGYITDTTAYTQVKGIMHANGGEQYLTIGMFMLPYDVACLTVTGDTLLRTCNGLFFIDDVGVEKIPTGPTFEHLLPKDTTIFPGDTVHLSTDNPNTLWSNGSIGKDLAITHPGTYWYIIKEPCFTYTDTIIISAEELIIYIPNAFTPNNDGLNDVFEVGVYGVSHFSAAVYNRWGQQVYQQSGGPGMFRWDGNIQGKPAVMGVYVLQINTVGRHGPKQFTEKISVLR